MCIRDSLSTGSQSIISSLSAAIYHSQPSLFGACDNITGTQNCSDIEIEITNLEPTVGGYIEGNFMGNLVNPVGEQVTIMADFRVQIDEILTTSIISGVVWQDTNRDGIRDGQDLLDTPPSFSGVTLWKDGNRISSVTTQQGSGFYSFNVQEEGVYTLQFSKPNNFVYTLQNQGSDDTIDSDADPTTGEIGNIVVGAGVNIIENNDVGLYYDGSVSCEIRIVSPPTCNQDNGTFQFFASDSSITDNYRLITSANSIVFSDEEFFSGIRIENVPAGGVVSTLLDENGVEVCEEAFIMIEEEFRCEGFPIAFCDSLENNFNVALELECNTTNQADITYSWSNGSTSEILVNVPRGAYTVTLTSASGCTTTVEVSPSHFPSPSIIGIVWEDNPLYKDNFYDAEFENALEGVTVQLFESSDLTMPVQTVVTTSLGYTFENLDSNNSYVVGIVQPNGLEFVVKQDPNVPNTIWDLSLIHI